MKAFVKGFGSLFKQMDWFEWFYLSFILFASVLFWMVWHELNRMFNP